MSLIVCSEKCIYQKDGYCTLDCPSTVTNPQGPLENRCIYLAVPEGSLAPQTQDRKGL